MLCFSNSFSSACTKCCVFPVPFLFPSSLPVPFQLSFQFPSRIPYVFPRKVRCRLFSFKKENIFVFSFKKVCNALSLEKHRESAKGTGKGTGRELEGNWERERELEKHSTSYTLKKRNWKNTAFSITPGTGNWKNTAFSIAPGKGNWKKHGIFNHAQEREQQQQQEQEQEQKQVGRTNTDVKQKNALAQYLSVHHH